MKFWPVYALVTIVVNLPNHVFDLSLERMLESELASLHVAFVCGGTQKTTNLLGFVIQKLKNSVKFVRVNFTVPA